MLWVLKRTVSMRHRFTKTKGFFEHPKHMLKCMGKIIRVSNAIKSRSYCSSFEYPQHMFSWLSFKKLIFCSALLTEGLV